MQFFSHPECQDRIHHHVFFRHYTSPLSPVCSLTISSSRSQGSIAMKDSIIPRIPRQHYCSYGQIPLSPPFSFLSQDSPLPSPSGAPSYMLHCDAGSLDCGPQRRTSSLSWGMSHVCCELTPFPPPLPLGVNLPSTLLLVPLCVHV